MADTVIAAAQRIYPANNGPSGTALARDEEIYNRDQTHLANFVNGGNLNYSGATLAVILDPLTVFTDGRQILQKETGSYGWTMPASVTRWVVVKRNGDLVLRDSASVASDEQQLWRIQTDGTGVTSVTDLRRLNQFTEIGVNSGERIYVSSDRTKYFYFDAGTGRLRLIGTLQPDRILGLPEPQADDEAATRAFVISQAGKVAKVASTANLVLSGTQTIDGIAAGVGDIVLAKNQTAPAENGLWVVAAGAWTRHGSLDASAEAVAGFTVYVQQGTVGGKTLWILTTTGAIVLGTTALTFEKTIGSAAYQGMPGNTPLNQIPVPTGSVDMNSQRIINLPNPATAGEPLTKGYAPSYWMPGVRGPRTQAFPLGSTNGVQAYAVGFSADGSVVVLVYFDSTGTRPLTVYVSADGGFTFTKTSANPGTNYPTTTGANGVAVWVTDANTFSIAYAGTGNVIAFAKTTNGGTSWTTNTQAIGTSTSLAVQMLGIDSCFGIYITSTTSANYVKTSNAGGAWTTGTVATETVSATTQAVAIAAVDMTTVYAFWYNATGTKGRWSKTTNGGSAWSAAADIVTNHNGSPTVAVAVDANTVLYAYRPATGPGVLRTTNGGTNWSTSYDFTLYPFGPSTTDGMSFLYQGGIVYLLTGYAPSAGEAFFLLLFSSDSGATWNRRQGPSSMVASAANGTSIKVLQGRFAIDPAGRILLALGTMTGTNNEYPVLIDIPKVVTAP